ncbi:hypothetical protein DLP63_24590 [Salmonella enterica]|nr:hypothetical protein [Salmonella enterica]
MDMESCLPLLYPLRYHIDHLAHRSLSTQSASLQTVKFFYEYGFRYCCFAADILNGASGFRCSRRP